MAAKTFTNHTGYNLAVVLTVRKGETPGNVSGLVNFTLAEGAQTNVTYGSSTDIYLDAISLSATGNGNLITSDDQVIVRGSSVDNDLNTHNHVTIATQQDSFVLGYSNN